MGYRALFFASFFMFGINARAGASRCREAVEHQELRLSAQSHAVEENKFEVLSRVRRGIIYFPPSKVNLVLRLLERKDTLTFSFSNRDGVWLTIAETRACKVLFTRQIAERD